MRRDEVDALLELAQRGTSQLFELQRAALAA
jgi:ribonuclease PH